MQIATIRLSGPDHRKLDELANEIKEIAIKSGLKVSGPIPLPTKRLRVTTRRTPCGDGSDTWDHYEMRIHKRLVNVETDERTIRQIMRIQVPENVHIEIELKEK